MKPVEFFDKVDWFEPMYKFEHVARNLKLSLPLTGSEGKKL